MKTVIQSTEEYLNFNCNCIEEEKRYISHIEFSETIKLDMEKPDFGQLISTVTESEIISIKIIDTIMGCSSDGQIATGKKAVARLKIREKILYSSNCESQTIHVVENEFYHSAYVVIPPIIEGTNPEILLKNKILKPRVSIEDIFIRSAASHSIFKYICLFFELFIVPTYELCYAMQEHTSEGNLFVSYQDGTHSNKLISMRNSIDAKPAWSPSGREIAFISHEQGFDQLCLINIKDSNKNLLTDPVVFKAISGYCWSPDGLNIVFSSTMNGIKELFNINTQTGKWSQLTHGNSSINSYKPKYSPDGRYIGFIKAMSGVANLYIQSTCGMDCKRVTSSGHIKNFAWSCDSRTLVCIRDKDGDPDEIFIADINSLSEKVINLCKCANRKRKIRFSPDGKYITFIGTAFDTDDIYTIDTNNNKPANLTKHSSGTTINSFCWNADSNKIYYSSNDNFYYNIYSLSIFHHRKHQITNTTSKNIQLCYRPKIK